VWLAGLLEDEVGRLLSKRPRLVRKRREHWSDYWTLFIAGGHAITLMQALAPVMGRRRSAQIDEAIKASQHAGAVLGWRSPSALSAVG
jgi:hypothetical protein